MTNTQLKTYFKDDNIPTAEHYSHLIDRLVECLYGTQNPPTLAQLAGIKFGDYYVQTSDGSATGAEIQRSLFDGFQLTEWTVTATVWNGLNADQKNAVKSFNITP